MRGSILRFPRKDSSRPGVSGCRQLWREITGQDIGIDAILELPYTDMETHALRGLLFSRSNRVRPGRFGTALGEIKKWGSTTRSPPNSSEDREQAAHNSGQLTRAPSC